MSAAAEGEFNFFVLATTVTNKFVYKTFKLTNQCGASS